MYKTAGKQTKKRNVFARFDPETHDRLIELAERDRRSVSYLVRKAVEQYLRRRQDSSPSEAA